MATSIATQPGATEIVVFQWAREHGACHECGLPAAFLPLVYTKTAAPPTETNKRCAVCAANAAADGEIVKRIDEDI